MRFSVLIIIITGFITAATQAQQPSYFHFDRITAYEGLPSDNTKKIIQDKQGFIWIGTSEGLCRYDGYHVTTFTYNPEQAHSLVNNFIYDLSEDEDGNIWIATAGGWCELLYNTQTFLNENDFKNFHGKGPGFNPELILADHYHHIIMGGYTGSCILNTKDSSFSQFHFPKQDGGGAGGLGNMYQDDRKLVWLEFQNYSCVYDPAKDLLYSPFNNPLAYPLIKYSAPLLRQGNTIWFGKWSMYVYAYDMHNNTTKIVGKDTPGIKDLTNDIQPTKMIADHAGNLWLLLSEKGVYYMDFKHNNFRVISNKANDYNSIPSQFVRDIMCDRDGNIWIATDKGVARWNNDHENFQLLSYNSYLPSRLIPESRGNFEIDDAMENDSDLWLAATPVGLLVMKKSEPAVHRHIQIDSGNLVSGMNRIINFLMKDKNGNTWVSTQEGYAKYNKQCDCLRPFFLKRSDITGNVAYQVMMMMQDKQGAIWLASKKGLGKLSPQTNIVEWISLPAIHTTGVPFIINKVIEQGDSVLWLVTDGGLFSFNKNTKQFQRYSSENRGNAWKAFDDCLDALFISDTAIMITTQFSGLIQFNPVSKHFRIYLTNDGLSSNNLRHLYADRYGGLWITTLNGLSCLNLKTKTFSRYDYSNGLKDLVFQNTNTFYPEKDGNVLLLDGAYILRFDPSQFVQRETTPQVTFTSVEKYDRPVFYDKPLNEMKAIHFAYSDRYFTIRFSTLSFENTSRTQYSYRMKGLDNTLHITNTPFVSYSNLSGGSYTLYVKASLDGNTWSPEKELSISVTPPFWKTWWFYTACVVLISATIFSFYRMRIGQLKHELFLRSKIARDLHDDVGSTLSSLHMVSALAIKKIKDDPDKTKALLEKITESSERMTGNMQDIVWAVNPVNDSFAEIIARMQKFAAEMLELKNIELHFNADEKIKSLKLPLEYRSDLFMIFKEAINNVAKYSNAHHTWIILHKNNKSFFLEIKDDGVGFDVKNTTKGNGLRNMQERAKNLNGRLIVLSGDKGTKITLEFSV
jgi:ligand-binding sensor domain-containing protein/two-component sensor histidine kinase